MSGEPWREVLIEARPRAIAALLRAFRDLEIAEDAYQEACVRALRSWRAGGPPKDPTAWLILVGRNVAIDGLRRMKRVEALGMTESKLATPDLADSASKDSALADLALADSVLADSVLADSTRVGSEDREVEGLDRRAYGDDVLRLFFVCCDEALEPSAQIALALKVVAGLTVPEIARAFLLKPKTLEKRLTRAKKVLARPEVRYGAPSPAERAERLPSVTAMIYLLFNEGYGATGGEAHVRAPLCDEAIRLARCLLRVAPSEPEVMGLLALCLLQHSRVDARLDTSGDLVPLADQDRSLWRRPLIAEGRVLVEKALRRSRPGPLQIQAAIAAVHSQAEASGNTDWPEIERLYLALGRHQPSPVVTLNLAVAVRESRGPEAALKLVEPLADELDGYFHFHGVYGTLLADLGRFAEARSALERALALSRTPAERRHLEEKLRQV